MADNNKPSKDLNPAYAKFADKMIELIDQLEDETWQQSWANKKHILSEPENIRGNQYTGLNSTFLHLVHLIEKYKVPLYMTYNQARELGANVKQGAKAYPVIRMNPWYKDKDGKTVKTSEAEKMTEEERKEKGITMFFGSLSLYHVFNLDQTNLKEINEKKYNALVDKFKPYVATEKDTEGMYVNHELDRMVDKQEWDCPIESQIESNRAFYRPSVDIVVVPTKAQFRLGKEPFIEGQRYYSTLIHEMAHSTGAESRLNRDFSGKFGSKKYAKEELVAELTSGFITQKMGFDEKILINNAAYLKSWLGALRDDPKEIIDAMYKVNKASEMITNAIQEQKEKIAQENGQVDKTDQQLSEVATIKDAEKPQKNEDMKVQVSTAPFTREIPTWETYEKEKGKDGDFTYQETAEEYGKTLLNGVEDILPRVKGTIHIDQWGEKSLTAQIDGFEEVFVSRYIPDTLSEWVDAMPKEENHVNMQSSYTNKSVDIAAAYIFSAVLSQKEGQQITLSFSDDKQSWKTIDEVSQAKQEGLLSVGEFEALSALDSSKGILEEGIIPNAISTLKNRVRNSENFGYDLKEGVKEAIDILESGKITAAYTVTDKHEEAKTVSLPKPEELDKTDQQLSEVATIKDAENSQQEITREQTVQKDQEQPVQFSSAILGNFADYMNGKTFYVKDEPNILYQVTGVDKKDPAMIKFNMDILDKNSGKVEKVSEYVGSMAEGLASGEKWVEYDIKNNKPLGLIEQNINESTNKLHHQNNNTLSDKQGAEQSSSKKEKEETQQNVSIQEDNNPNTDIANKVKALMQSEGISKEVATQKVTSTMTNKINEAAAKKQETAKQAERQKNEAERISEDRKRKQREIAESARRSEESRQKSDTTDGTIMKLAITSTLLLAALESAKNNKGIWLNKAGKSNAEMANGRTPITPYNNLMMNLHSDKEGYRSNVYTFGQDAATTGTPVRKNEEALPFNWVDWQYQNIETKETISKAAYNELDDTAKQSYAKHGVRTKLNVFNIDQTVMATKDHDKYNSLLKSKGEQNEVLSDNYSHDPIKLERQIGKDFPKTITLFHENNDMVRTYGASATFMGKELNLPIEKVPHGKYEVKSVHFPSDRLEFAMSKILDAGRRISMVDKIDSPELIKALPEKNDVVMKAITMAHKTADAMGVKYDRVNILQPTEYNEDKNEFIISNLQDKTAGNKREAAIEKANDIYRNMVAMTGSENRLDRMGRFGLLPQDEQKYEKLVQELSAGIFMARQGLPAKISKENQSLIPYWERELTENPKKLAAIIERDVNNSVEVIDKTLEGKKINYEAIRNKLPFKQNYANTKEYGVTEMLSKFPNAESKEVVIIKDNKSSKADVLLPNGASLEMGNEISGIRKDRIITALRKEGVNDVKFYNAGGEYALKEKNDYFADKNISLGRLKQYEFVERRPLEVQSKIAESKEVEIEKFTHIKNDEGKYEFLIKANNEPSFSVTPTAEHRQQYFAARKDPAATDSLLNMAKYYYNAAKRQPSMKHDVIMPKIPEGIDTSKIERPTITKDEDGRKFVMATINDKFEKAPITDNQWNRMWLADDMQAYKTAIAAVTFAPKLQQHKQAAQTVSNNNTDSKSMTEEKKFELVPESKITDRGTEYYRIRALKDFGDVKKGDLGGYVEKEENLSQEGDAWIYDDAKVRTDAVVSGNAKIREEGWLAGNAQVYGNAEVSGKAILTGNTQVYDNAKVSGRMQLSDNAKIYGNAQVNINMTISNNVEIYDNAKLDGAIFVKDNAKVYGNANIHGSAYIAGNTQVSGNAELTDGASIKDDVIITGETKLGAHANVSGKGILNVNDTITEEIKLSERANDNDLSETAEQDQKQEEQQTKGISR